MKEKIIIIQGDDPFLDTFIAYLKHCDGKYRRAFVVGDIVKSKHQHMDAYTVTLVCPDQGDVIEITDNIKTVRD